VSVRVWLKQQLRTRSRKDGMHRQGEALSEGLLTLRRLSGVWSSSNEAGRRLGWVRRHGHHFGAHQSNKRASLKNVGRLGSP
jgi:hypothetical protein